MKSLISLAVSPLDNIFNGMIPSNESRKIIWAGMAATPLIGTITIVLLGIKAFLILLIPVVAYLIIRYKVFALWIYFIALPFLMQYLLPIYIPVSIGAAILIIFLWIARRLLNPGEAMSFSGIILIYAFLFILANIVSALNNGINGGEAKTIIRLVIFFLFVFAIYDLNKLRQTTPLFIAITIPMLFSSIMLIHAYSDARGIIAFLDLYRMKPAGIFPNSNILGHVLMVIVPFWIAMTIWQKNKNIRLISFLLTLILSATLVLTNARAAIFGFAVSTILFFFWTRKLRYLLVVIFSIAVLLLLIPSIGTLISLGLRLERGTTSRTEIWANTLDMIEHNPILGVGPGNFSDAYMQYFQTGWQRGFFKTIPNAHYFIINLMAELGIAGLLLSIAIFILPLREAAKALRKVRLEEDRAIVYALTASIVAIFAHSFFEAGGIVGSGRPFADILFWLSFGILIRINKLPDGFQGRIFS